MEIGSASWTRLVGWTALAAAVAALSLGCDANARHKVLSALFDGVPPPGQSASARLAGPNRSSQGVRPAHVGGEHGPFAAKLCDACHDSKAVGSMVAPGSQLCLRCHDLGEQKKFVHGPLASGGCLACHDPHRSPNRYLLVAASDTFCLKCHDRGELSPTAGHQGTEATCTRCHDAHMSDRRYLLK